MKTPLKFSGLNEKRAHEILALKVAEKAGLEAVYSFDCLWLAFEILRVTGKHVSETTLKRFFGAAKLKFQFSISTRNTLSEYVGFDTWRQLVENLSDNQSNTGDFQFWEELRKKALRITRFTSSTLKKHTEIPYDHTIARTFAEAQIDLFFQSNYSITAFIAPSGYGKSVLLSHIIDKNWLNDEPLHGRDIVWVITGQSVGGLKNIGFDLDEWFASQVGLGEEENMHAFLSNNPSEVRGRMVLILDGFDDSFQKDDQLHAFFTKIIDLITVNSASRYLKVILSLRPDSWEHIAEQVKNSSFLKGRWLLGLTYRPATEINVPAFTEPEVKQIVRNLWPSLAAELSANTELLSQLSNPCYISLLYKQLLHYDPDRDRSPYIESFNLIDDFIRKNIYQDQLSSSKIALLKRFIEHSDFFNYQGYINKERFICDGRSFKSAYKALLACGVLVEENQSKSLAFKKVVRLTQDNLIEYFVAREFISKNRNSEPGSLLIEALFYYKGSTQLVPILKWLIYHAIDQNRFDDLMQVSRLDLPGHEKEALILFSSSLLAKKQLGPEGLKNEGVDNMPQESLLLSFICSDLTGIPYRNALENLSLISRTTSERLCLLAFSAQICLMNLDLEGMNDRIQIISGFDHACCQEFIIDPYRILVFISNYLAGEYPSRFLVLELMELLKENNNRFIEIDNQYDRLIYDLSMSLVSILNSSEDARLFVSCLHPAQKSFLFRLRHRQDQLAGRFHYAFEILCRADLTLTRRFSAFLDIIQEKQKRHDETIWIVFRRILEIKSALLEGHLVQALTASGELSRFYMDQNLAYYKLICERLFNPHLNPESCSDTESQVHLTDGFSTQAPYNLERLRYTFRIS